MEPVVVSNVFPDDNKGGCAITVQTIAWLKREFPSSPVYIVPVEQSGSYDRDRFRFTLARHPDVRVLRSPIRTDGAIRTTLAMLIRSLRLLLGRRPGGGEFERVISGAALVVSKGGFVFVERGTFRNLLALWFTAFPLVYAARVKAPTLALCTTVGPFRRASSRALCRWILVRVDAIVTRDPISTAEARALGRADVIECPDIVLTHEAPTGPPPAALERSSSPGRYGVVVISGTGLRQDAIFLDRVRELLRRILDAGLVDGLVVPLQSLEDAAISARLLRSLDDPRCVGIEDDLSPEELMRLYRGARFLVGRRLHGGLFAMLVGTPVILFATDGVKTHGVMSALGLSSRVAPYPDFDVDQVHRALVDLLHGEQEERTTIARLVREARETASATLRALGGRFRSRPEPRPETRERIG